MQRSTAALNAGHLEPAGATADLFYLHGAVNPMDVATCRKMRARPADCATQEQWHFALTTTCLEAFCMADPGGSARMNDALKDWRGTHSAVQGTVG